MVLQLACRVMPLKLKPESKTTIDLFCRNSSHLWTRMIVCSSKKYTRQGWSFWQHSAIHIFVSQFQAQSCLGTYYSPTFQTWWIIFRCLVVLETFYKVLYLLVVCRAIPSKWTWAKNWGIQNRSFLNNLAFNVIW